VEAAKQNRVQGSVNRKPAAERGNTDIGDGTGGSRQVAISEPNEVASLVLVQIDAVNAKKDELTIAIKGLTDLTKQLVRAYGEHTKHIQQLELRVRELEQSQTKAKAS